MIKKTTSLLQILKSMFFYIYEYKGSNITQDIA